jgi:hypothetical protein
MSVKSILSGVAPFLSVAANLATGGATGTAVKIAASILTKITGSDVKEEQVADVMTNLATTEEGRLKLQESEQAYQKAMAELKFDNIEKMRELENADRDSARKREIAVRDWTPRALAIAVVAVTAFLEGWVLLHGLPASIDGVVAGRILGTLDAATMLVLSYYFGSSVGSLAKDDTVAAVVAASR